MKKRTARQRPILLVRPDILQQIRTMLRQANQKLDYLIRNLHRFNGHHDSHYPTLHHLSD